MAFETANRGFSSQKTAVLSELYRNFPQQLLPQCLWHTMASQPAFLPPLSRDLSSPPLPSPWHSSLAPAPLLDYTPTPFQMLYQDKVMSVCDREGRTLSAGILKIYSHLQKCLPATEIKPTLFLCKQSRSREGLKTRIFSQTSEYPTGSRTRFHRTYQPTHTSSVLDGALPKHH